MSAGNGASAREMLLLCARPILEERESAFDYTITVSNLNKYYLRWWLPLLIFVEVFFAFIAIVLLMFGGASFGVWFLIALDVIILLVAFLILRGGHTMHNIVNKTGVANLTVGKQEKVAKGVAGAGAAVAAGVRSFSPAISGAAALSQVAKGAMWKDVKRVIVNRKDRRIVVVSNTVYGGYKPMLFCTPDNFDSILTYIKMHIPESATLIEKK